MFHWPLAEEVFNLLMEALALMAGFGLGLLASKLARRT
jgi:hypothetical protein